jgi:hypothetical protein
MKTCRICKVEKSFSEFHLNSSTKDGYENRCKCCRKEEASKRYQVDPFDTLARCKKAECKKKGITYGLDAEYLRKLWTGLCPITGTAITIGNSGNGSHRSAHLDRINPLLGYTKGNVCYISGRANRIKYNATIKELEQVIEYMKRHERAETISKESTSEV